jgi:hypothetical protein
VRRIGRWCRAHGVLLKFLEGLDFIELTKGCYKRPNFEAASQTIREDMAMVKIHYLDWKQPRSLPTTVASRRYNFHNAFPSVRYGVSAVLLVLFFHLRNRLHM